MKLARSADTRPLPGDASGCHSRYPLFFEVRGISTGDALGVLNATMTGIHLASDTWITAGASAYSSRRSSHVIPATKRSLITEGWGHSTGAHLDRRALLFAGQHGPRIYGLMYNETFNRLANAVRLYESALLLTPSDVAVVVFVSVLEGLFSSATQELALRLALAVSNYLERAPERRRLVFDEVKTLYTARSKIVHGDKLHRNEEKAAFLCEDYVGRAETLARRCIHKVFLDRLDKFIETSKRLDEFFTLLALGYSLDTALVKAGGARG